MNGFDKEEWQCGTPRFSSCPNANPPYSYVPHSETQPYFDMGEQYVVADQMYASNLDGSSFISHQYIIAGQSEEAVNYPDVWGCEGGSGDIIFKIGPNRQIPDGKEQACFSDLSLGQEADQAGVSWAYYTSALKASGAFWSAYQANRYVYYGSDWKNDVITSANAVLHRCLEWKSASDKLGNADVRELRPRELRLGYRPAMGGVTRQCDRPIQVLE